MKKKKNFEIFIFRILETLEQSTVLVCVFL